MKQVIILLMILYSISGFSNNKSKIGTRLEGKYLITAGDTVNVVVLIDTIVFPQEPDCESHCDSIFDVSLKILDDDGKILYIDNSIGQYVYAKLIELKGIGNALLIYNSDGPCYGSDICNCFQIFGFNSLGYFIPYTGIIYSDNIDFNVKWFPRNAESAFDFKDIGCELCESYLELKSFIKFCQIQTYRYYPTYSGGFSPSMRYNENIFDKFPIKYGETNFQTIKDIDKDRFKDKIRLYSKPDTTSNFSLIEIKENSLIKYIEGCYKYQYFMHLRIDGREGYIIWDKLENLGLEWCD